MLSGLLGKIPRTGSAGMLLVGRPVQEMVEAETISSSDLLAVESAVRSLHQIGNIARLLTECDLSILVYHI